MDPKRRLVVIVLIIFTLVLGAVSIYVGLNLSDSNETLAPTDSSAAECVVDGANECDDDGKSYCGSACNTNADCIPEGANHSPTECRAGRCEAVNCPNTTAGANCDCEVATRTCGQSCGNGYPLCASGFVCRYVTGSSCTEQNLTNSVLTTYCVPADSDIIDEHRCTTRDTSNSYIQVGTQTTFTRAQVVALCNPVCGNGFIEDGEECDDGDENGTDVTDCTTTCVFADEAACGDGTVDSGESCDDGDNNGTASSTCTTSCTLKPQCSDGRDNDGDGKIDCTAGAQDPGCFPDGRGGGGSCNPNDNSEIDGALPATALGDNVPLKLIIGVVLIFLGYSFYKSGKNYRKIKLEM